MSLRLGDLPPGKQLMVRRRALDLYQREVADLLGTSESAVCRTERGDPRGSLSLLGQIDRLLTRLEAQRRQGGSIEASTAALLATGQAVRLIESAGAGGAG